MPEPATPAGDGYEFTAALFGAVCADPALITDVAVGPLTWDHWRFLEKLSVADEMAGQWIFADGLGQESPVRPPPCLVTVAPTVDEWEACAERMRTVVLALRLSGARSFLDPDLTVSTAVQGSFIQRKVGPYRMFGYSLLPEPADVIDADRVAEVTRLVGLIESRAARELLKPVQTMCAPMLIPSAVVLMVLQLIEGIYGRMGERISGLTFDERLARAGVPDELVGWMCGVGSDSGREIRNAVSHGRAVRADAADRLADFGCVAARAFLEVEPSSVGADPVARFRNTAWGGR
jgi:hypothetical protein